jgi:hypothetical protein
MNNEIQLAEKVQPYCLVLKNGIKIWLDYDSAMNLIDKVSEMESHKAIKFDDFEFNTAEHVGIFPQSVLGDLQKEKDGYTRCTKLKWHSKNEACTCFMPKFKG